MDRSEPVPYVPTDRVEDTELLYHAVRKVHFTRHSKTEFTVSENAYSDAQKKTSVDRAQINEFEPERTRFRESDAIVSLVTEEIRGIRSVFQNSESGRPIGSPYVFDVIPRPIKDHPDPAVRDNPAHAQI